MVNAWKAFIIRCVAWPEKAAQLHDMSDEDPCCAKAASVPFHYMPTTIDRTTYKLQLPSFRVNTPIILSDFYREVKLGQGQYKAPFGRKAELHLYYCKFPAPSLVSAQMQPPAAAWIMASCGAGSC